MTRIAQCILIAVFFLFAVSMYLVPDIVAEVIFRFLIYCGVFVFFVLLFFTLWRLFRRKRSSLFDDRRQR